MKLKAVIVDDEPKVFDTIKGLCKNSTLVEITHTFTNPLEFLKAAPSIDYDVALLDIQMEHLNGIEVAGKLENKAVIFITGAFNYLKDAVRTPYVAVVLKPIEKDFLESALIKARLILQIDKKENNVEYKLFNLQGLREKVNIRLSDIVYVQTDCGNPRNKIVFLKGGANYKLTDCRLEDLLALAPKLFQVNKGEVVSIEAIQTISIKTITIELKENSKEIELGRSFRNELLKRIG
ncbi:MAG TPA: LytTR family DNA-binding domain-containing protein [Bacteroidia bacterium]|jgi:DNA-binding LytR/AlgR family response regulator|nr:LytTR family DNA-binding domain-containing protein [Bacteroidia bacterium]